MRSDKNVWRGIGAILFLVSTFSMGFNIIPLAAATEEVTELTIENPYGCTITGSTVDWMFEIIEPDKVASPGETVYFTMRITNLPTSTVPLELSYYGVSFDPGLHHTNGRWSFDGEWPTVPIGETYEGPFGHFTWTSAVPIGYVQGGYMGVGVYYGSPSGRSVPYSVTIRPVLVEIDIKPETLNLKSKGVFTAFIELPEGYGEEDVDINTVECEGAPALKAAMANDGKLILKFDREDLVGISTGDAVELTVTGEFTDGVPFAGSDTITVID